MTTNYLSAVTPTWAAPIREEYNVSISPSKNMKRDYYLFSPTPVLEYRLDFEGLSEEDYQILQQQYRDVSGQFGAFYWQSIPKYMGDIISDRIVLTTLTDRSGFGHDAAVSGTTICKGQDNANWALNYDGVDDYSGATCSSDAWTYTAWINPIEEQTGSQHPIIHKYFGYGHGLYLNYNTSPNRFIVNYKWSGGTNASTAIAISSYNTWYFIVGTYSSSPSIYYDSNGASKPLLYINGSNVATGAILNDITATSMLTSSVSIGGGITARYANAKIGECRIYNCELSATSINTLYSGGSITGGLIGLWDCNDVSMYGRWSRAPEIKINSRSFNIGMIFEKDLE